MSASSPLGAPSTRPLPAEWRRRQELVGMIPPMDYSNDVRLEHDHVVRENWSHEQVRGAGCVCLRVCLV